VGALWTWRPRPSRTGALATTLAVHVAAVAALVLAFHREPHPPSTIAFVSTLILLSAPVRRPEIPDRERWDSNQRFAPLRPAEPPPLAPLPITPSLDEGTTIDWAGQAREVAVFEAQKMTGREREPQNRNDDKPGAPEPGRTHTAGEQYRTATGDSVVWVSDRCYVISEKPLPGTPPTMAGSKPTRTVCPGDSGNARGDLFKDVPAYRKRHPL